jgi:hypothetical protein
LFLQGGRCPPFKICRPVGAYVHFPSLDFIVELIITPFQGLDSPVG